MRLKHVKGAEEIVGSSKYVIKDYLDHKGDFNKLFGNNNPIRIEIGMGKGNFIIENAIRYPDINFIGIEKYDSVIAKALLKIPENVPNLKMIRGNALEIDSMFDHEVDCIYLNFSDPWPKKRHHLRRLSSHVFLEKYESIFKGEKVIEMRTDNSDLFQYSLVSFSTFGYVLEEIYFDLHKEKMPSITTEYEDKFSKDDLPIYFVRCLKP
jgi:tRNA (guanine-N7-)-methyltransferase